MRVADHQPETAAGTPLTYASLTFPKDRKMLYVPELAARLRISRQQVLNLIEEGRIRAVNVAGHNRTGRRCYRVPIEAWQAYLRENLV